MILWQLPVSLRRWIRLLKENETTATNLLFTVLKMIDEFERDIPPLLPPEAEQKLRSAREYAFDLSIITLSTSMGNEKLNHSLLFPATLTKADIADILQRLEIIDVHERKKLINTVVKLADKQELVRR